MQVSSWTGIMPRVFKSINFLRIICIYNMSHAAVAGRPSCHLWSLRVCTQ